MRLSFAARRRFIRAFWRSHDRMNEALTWFFEDFCHYQPRKHSLIWFAAIWLFIACPVCYFTRAFALGLVAGALMFFVLGRLV
jgi:hypothetical protein